MGLDKSVKLGSWNRAEDYINNIMKVNVDKFYIIHNC